MARALDEAQEMILEPPDWDDDKWIRYQRLSRRQHEMSLTRWVLDESALHITAGRFEHALCLLERYHDWPVALTRADDFQQRLKREAR